MGHFKEKKLFSFGFYKEKRKKKRKLCNYKILLADSR